EIQQPWLAEQIEQVLERVAAGGVCQLIRKRLDREDLVDTGNRTHPADANVRLGRSVFAAKIGDIERDIGPTLAQVSGIAENHSQIECGRDGREGRALEPRRGPAIRAESG